MESKQDTRDSTVCMCLPIPTIFLPFFFFKPSGHLQPYVTDEKKHQAYKKLQENMSSKNTNTLAHIQP